MPKLTPYFLFNGKETGIVESIGPICRDIIDIGDAFTMAAHSRF